MMQRKNTLILTLALVLVSLSAQFSAVSAQSTTTTLMQVHKTDGSIVEFSTSEVEYVSFSTTQKEDTQNGKIINGHKFVDLGLPSGLLWAETNVGAESLSDYGNYYAWGETSVKLNYDWSTYKYGKASNDMTKYSYIDDKSTLECSDDAAWANWGTSCRMPTKTELAELNDMDNCTWEWTTVNDVKGYKVTGKKAGYTDNWIFLPASGGYYDGECHYQGDTCYLSSSRYNYPAYDAFALRFNSDNHKVGYSYRCYGNVVRPVAEP